MILKRSSRSLQLGTYYRYKLFKRFIFSVELAEHPFQFRNPRLVVVPLSIAADALSGFQLIHLSIGM
jgi:hypothetical protein